jgi:hypothetical protein
MTKKIFFIAFVLFSLKLMAQDTQLGSRDLGVRSYQGGFFDYSDPQALNIKVSIWGFVNYPGKYIIPSYSTVADLISYAGGPNENAELDDIRLYRLNEDGSENIIQIDYNNLMWETDLNYNRQVPELKASDVLTVTGSRRLYFNDWLSMGLSVFSALISLTILILTVK